MSPKAESSGLECLIGRDALARAGGDSAGGSGLMSPNGYWERLIIWRWTTMVRTLTRMAFACSIVTAMMVYISMEYLYAQQRCPCEQICYPAEGCWEGSCPAGCQLELVQRFRACCTLWFNVCCDATVEKYKCVPITLHPDPDPVPVPLSTVATCPDDPVLFKFGEQKYEHRCRNERCQPM